MYSTKIENKNNPLIIETLHLLEKITPSFSKPVCMEIDVYDISIKEPYYHFHYKLGNEKAHVVFELSVREKDLRIQYEVMDFHDDYTYHTVEETEAKLRLLIQKHQM